MVKDESVATIVERRKIRTVLLSKVSALVLLVSAMASAAGAQTLFSTDDYRQDRALWTDPAYFRHLTAAEFRNVHRTGDSEGSGADEFELVSPYPYLTSEEHFRALLEAANAGTTHTIETLPDWDGYVTAANTGWLSGAGVQASTIVSVLSPQYQEYYVQQLKAESEGRAWWPSAFCLPDGFLRGIQLPEQFIVRPREVIIINNVQTETQVRRVYVDERGHAPTEDAFPQWLGESIGFWDGDALIVHTNQIKQWNASRSAIFEFSDQLTAVERYERDSGGIVGEVTLYDPIALAQPVHATMRFEITENPEFRAVYSTCTDTDGPATNVYANSDGVLSQRAPGDPGYWDASDPRPWAAHYALGER